jgi:EAL domain-containing protein (putative c-di-GMP-specific phosphodiesterase class I)
LSANDKPTLPRRLSNQFDATPFTASTETGQKAGDSSSALRRLISAESLSVVFQPIVDLTTLRTFAFEALVRCSLPAFSDPTRLFKRAVEDGCCGRLGRMIREVAVPLCSGHPVFLNAHPIELEERWLVRPDDPMFFHDREVYLEITESVPFTHFQTCRDVLREIRSRGQVKLVVDDLGAGYSNLLRIADLEPAVVKLDRALVAGLHTSRRQQILVKSVVRLCNELGARVVAEGIETSDEMSAVIDSGAHYAQGYYLARPAFPLPDVTVRK